MPRADCSLYLGLALPAHEIVDGRHEIDRRSSFDGHGERRIVMRFPRSEWHDGSVKKSPHTIDHVAVGHAHAHDRKIRLGRRPRQERSFSLEDPDEPMEIGRVDERGVIGSGTSCQRWSVYMQSAGRLGGSDPPLRGPQPLVLPLHHSRRDRQGSPSHQILDDYSPRVPFSLFASAAVR